MAHDKAVREARLSYQDILDKLRDASFHRANLVLLDASRAKVAEPVQSDQTRQPKRTVPTLVFVQYPLFFASRLCRDIFPSKETAG